MSRPQYHRAFGVLRSKHSLGTMSFTCLIVMLEGTKSFCARSMYSGPSVKKPMVWLMVRCNEEDMRVVGDPISFSLHLGCLVTRLCGRMGYRRCDSLKEVRCPDCQTGNGI